MLVDDAATYWMGLEKVLDWDREDIVQDVTFISKNSAIIGEMTPARRLLVTRWKCVSLEPLGIVTLTHFSRTKWMDEQVICPGVKILTVFFGR